MDDPYVKLGWKILKVVPHDDSLGAYEARLAVHSLVWTIWHLEDSPKHRDAIKPSSG